MIARTIAEQHPHLVMWGFGLLTFIGGFIIGLLR